MSDFKSRTSKQNDLSDLIVKVVNWCEVSLGYWELKWAIWGESDFMRTDMFDIICY